MYNKASLVLIQMRKYSRKHRFGKMSYLGAATAAANVIGSAYKAYKNRGSKNASSRKTRRDTRFRKRPAGSLTQTQTKKRRKFVANGDGLTSNSYTYKYKPMTGYDYARKLSKSDIYAAQNSGSFVSSYGRQGVSTISYQMNAGMIVDTFQQCKQSNAVMNTLLSTGTYDKDRSLWIDSLEERFLLSNHSPGTALLKIYDVICADNLAGAPDNAWQVGLSNTGGLDPSNDLNVFWATTPTDSITFKRTWKIVNSYDVELHTGRTHRHVKNIHWGGLMPYEKAVDSATVANFKGITHATMVVAHGMPTSNIAAGSTSSVVTLDKVKINWVSTTKIKSRLLSLKGKHVQFNQNLNIAPSNTYQQQADAPGTFDSTLNTINGLSAFS